MIALVTTMTLLLVLLFTYRMNRRNILTNKNILAGVFTLVVALHSLNLAYFQPLSLKLGAFIIFFFLIYALTAAVATYKFDSKMRFRKSRSGIATVYVNTKIKKIVFMLWLVSFVQFLFFLNSTVGILGYFTSGLARKIMSQDIDINIYFYIFGYLYITLTLASARPHNKRGQLFELISIGLILISLLTTAAKINFISGCFLVYVLWFRRNNNNLRDLFVHGFYGLLLMYAFIVIFSLFTGKVVDRNFGAVTSVSDFFQLSYAFFLYPYEYVAGALEALNSVFGNLNSSNYSFGSYSFNAIYRALITLNLPGATDNIPFKAGEFVVLSAFNTNVYTFFYDPLLDFGAFVTALLAIPLAILHSYLDSKETYNPSLGVTILSSSSKLCCFISFADFKYGDTYFIVSVLIFLVLAFRSVFSSPSN